jgi:S-adenosylmethionine hydrolase
MSGRNQAGRSVPADGGYSVDNTGGIITLTTDFGTRDWYVAAMKGVMLGINPEAHVVDLSHDIESHNVLQCALFLRGSALYFPSGSVHVIVVDPGVGTGRRPICVKTADRYYVAPDNGVLSLVVPKEEPLSAVAIENPVYLRSTISATFHGRDVFAPAAAHLSLGVDMQELGREVNDIARLDMPMPEVTDEGEVEAEIIHVDHFGNLITNMDRTSWEHLTGGRDDIELQIACGNAVLRGISRTYGDVGAGELLALWGSGGLLEIAVNQEDAAKRTGVNVGDKVRISLGTR